MTGSADEISPATDDPTITVEAELWRRIHPDWWIKDHGTGIYRLASAAWENAPHTNALSVTIADETAGEHVLLDGHQGYGVAAITAGLARANHQVIARFPTQEDPAHAHVIGNKPKSVRNALRKGSRILAPPQTG